MTVPIDYWDPAFAEVGRQHVQLVAVTDHSANPSLSVKAVTAPEQKAAQPTEAEQKVTQPAEPEQKVIQPAEPEQEATRVFKPVAAQEDSRATQTACSAVFRSVMNAEDQMKQVLDGALQAFDSPNISDGADATFLDSFRDDPGILQRPLPSVCV